MYSARSLAPFLVMAVFVVAANGCGSAPAETSRVNQRNYDAIRVGMKIPDVVALLGAPTEKGPVARSGDCVWYWRDGDRMIGVMFEPVGNVRASGYRVIKYSKNLK